MQRFLAILFLAMTGAVSVARGQTAEGGLSLLLFQTHPLGTFHWDRWMEATVRARNEGTAPFEGRVVVDFPTAPMEGAVARYARPILLPARSQADVDLLVRFPSSAARPAGKGAMLPVRVRLMRGQATHAQDTFPCAMQSEEGPAIAWCDVGESLVPYRLKKQVREAGKKDAPGESGRRAYAIEVVLPDRLPRRAVGFGPYDAVVLSRWDERHLDALQVEALETWVRGGGRLLAIAGPHWKDHPNPRLEALLPLLPKETYRTSHLPALSSAFGELGIQDGVDVYDGDRGPGRILLGSEDQPFLIERRVGFGAVLFLALDVDRSKATDFPGMERLIRRALAETVKNPVGPSFSSPRRASEMVESLVAVRILPRGKMALWLGGYVTLVAVALLGARALRRAEYGYLAVALVAIGVAIGFHSWRRAMRHAGGESIERVRAYLAESFAGESFVRIDGIEGFFPLKERPMGGLLDAFHGIVEPAVMGQARAEVIEFTTDDLPGVGAWGLEPNAVRALRVETGVSMKSPPISWSARLTPEGMKVQVASGLEWTLEDVFVKWNRFVVPIGTLSPGETRDFETWKLREHQGRFQTANVQGRWVLVEGMLRRAVYPDASGRFGFGEALPTLLVQSDQARSVALGGFVRSSPRLWGGGREEAEAVVGLWLARGEEDALTADAEFTLPAGVARLTLGGKSGRISHLGGGEFAGNGEEQILVYFSLPPVLRGATLRAARLHGSFESLHFVAKAEAAWGTAGVEPSAFSRVAWPLEGGAVLPDPSPGQDALWVRLQVGRPGGSPAKADPSSTTLQHWNVRGLDLSAEGPVQTMTATPNARCESPVTRSIH